jgi:hypothetical protein
MQLKRKAIEMRKLLVVLFLSTCLTTFGQPKEDIFIIVTIERITSSDLHSKANDYWVIPKALWNESERPIIPFYLDGFSRNDIDECCISDSLVLFNYDSKESFVFEESFRVALGKLKDIMGKERKKVQTIKKKWNGYREEITVYLTPVKGRFCVCKLIHAQGNDKIGYEGQAAVPVSDFNFDPDFWLSTVAKQIERFDYGSLPFIALHKIQ